jgi:hypothetical protein
VEESVCKRMIIAILIQIIIIIIIVITIIIITPGVSEPRAVVVTYSDYASRVASVRRLRDTYPGVPILTRGAQITHVYSLEKAGMFK